MLLDGTTRVQGHSKRGRDENDVRLAHCLICSKVGVRRSPRTSLAIPPTKAPGNSPIAAPTVAPDYNSAGLERALRFSDNLNPFPASTHLRYLSACSSRLTTSATSNRLSVLDYPTFIVV
jgi:hypothetical protein